MVQESGQPVEMVNTCLVEFLFTSNLVIAESGLSKRLRVVTSNALGEACIHLGSFETVS